MFPGPQGVGWMKGLFNVPSSNSYQVKFEAIRGNGYRSEIAIDDIRYRVGTCLPIGKEGLLLMEHINVL